MMRVIVGAFSRQRQSVGDELIVDFSRRTLSRLGRATRCGPQMFKIAAAMAAANGRYVSIEDIVEYLHGDDPDGGPDGAAASIRVLVFRLRALLRDIGIAIETEYCFGYRIVEVAA